MKLKSLLDSGKFVVSSEVHSSSEKDPETISEDDFHLWEWADMLRLKISPQDRPEGHLTALCRTLIEKNFALELEVRTRNVNRLGIAKVVTRACNAGVENLVIFTQDYWISGDSIQEIMYFHVDMGKFFSVTDALGRGYDVDGQTLDRENKPFIGAGVDPQFGEHAPDMQLREMERLAEHGVGYFVTKPVFDPDVFAGFMKRVSKLNVPVIAEVVMLQSASEAFFLNSLSWINIPPRLIERIEKAELKPDATAAITIEIIERLRDLCAGVHLVHYGDIARIAPVMKSLR
jgi:methylenetetrahydrofolate reductase (NADPH)